MTGTVLLFANTDWYLFNFRLSLALKLRDEGWHVILMSPSGKYHHEFESRGLKWIPFEFSRKGLNPLSEFISLVRLIGIYRRIKPNVTHHFTVKCVIYGSVAARLTGAATVNSITGMGHVFTTHSLKNRLLRPFIRICFRQATRTSLVIFQNPDDRLEFLNHNLINSSQARTIRGSGVDIERFKPSESRCRKADTPAVIMVARLLREKGVLEFIEAAAIAKRLHPQTRFLLVGDTDPGNPSSFTNQQIENWQSEGIVEFLGHRQDVHILLQNADIAVLPSHREGTPKSLLEAAASGLPLIATDVPGCREVVVNGVNGFLTPPHNPLLLSEAMLKLLSSSQLRLEMGIKSRMLAVDSFSDERVLEATLSVYQDAMAL